MIYAIICTALAALCVGAGVGYLVGRYNADLLAQIELLKHKNDEPVEVPADPTITMGDYAPPREISTAADDRPVGIVESKTPERVDWETSNAIDKEVLGR